MASARVSALLGHQIASINASLSAAAMESIMDALLPSWWARRIPTMAFRCKRSRIEVLIPFKYPNTQCGPPTATPSCPAPAPGPGVPTPPPPTIFVFNSNYVEPYTQQFSLGVEYRLAKDTALTVSYLGVHGVRLQRTRDINLA